MNFVSIIAGAAGAFPGVFVVAEAVWPGSPVRDAGGSIVTPGTPVRLSCRSQFDAPTQAMRAAEGFLETDTRILVLDFAQPLDSEAKVVVASGRHAGTWALLTCQRDPAGVGWECRARKVA